VVISASAICEDALGLQEPAAAEEAGSFENTARWRGIRLFFGGDGAYIIKKQGGRRMRRGRLGKECGTLDPISDRVLMLAVYIADTGATVLVTINALRLLR